jgi:hypothetical protein
VEYGVLQTRGRQADVGDVVEHVVNAENLADLRIVRSPKSRVGSGFRKLLQASSDINTQSAFDQVTFVTQTGHAVKGMLLNSTCIFLHQNTDAK